jgi:hypothetical protein
MSRTGKGEQNRTQHISPLFSFFLLSKEPSRVPEPVEKNEPTQTVEAEPSQRQRQLHPEQIKLTQIKTEAAAARPDADRNRAPRR